MEDRVFLNFYVVSILIASAFYFVVSLFIFAGIKQRSRATTLLGWTFFMAGILAFSYGPGYALYHPSAAYHRWATVPSSLFNHILLAQVLYHMDTPRFPRASKIVFVVQTILALIATAIFIKVTATRETVFIFAGAYWDLDADDITRLTGGLLILNLLNVIVTGVLHMFAWKHLRWTIGGLLGAMLWTTLVPTITNVMSRDGLVGRDLHQTLITLFSVTGLFALLIVYLNNTRERTTFMVKIVGVSLVLFMVVMVFISLFSFAGREDAYDSVHREATAHSVAEQDYRLDDLVYFHVFDPAKNEIRILSGAGSLDPGALRLAEDENENTVIYQRIRALRMESWKQDLERLLKDSGPNFDGYRRFLLANAGGRPSPLELLRLVDGEARQISYRAKKIREIPDAKFRDDLAAYAGKMPPNLQPFAEAVRARMDAHPSSNARELRESVLELFQPFRPEGFRHYRGSGGTHYTAFMKYDAKRNLLYEAGYSYLAYKRFLNPVGVELAAVFLGVVLVMIFGFRLFFYGTLVRPLDALVAGVGKVNEGRLDIEVPVRVPDEIGYLTESFNSMVSSIRTARQKLERYADELEEKVKERTAELRETLQTVEALKEQQDGDYFLTSLLIKPLSRNVARSETVDVEFLMEQKKKFAFRMWKEEIGGDFCSAHSIDLTGKQYTVILNADAMGKSMQGAGGALVLGAVFESLMERTKTVPSIKNHSPERWLKNAFQELHAVFESFDGSMLVSMVLGLVDDQTGLFYYMNVEHPWTALYRGGKASFIEERHSFRKLGIPGLSGQVSVKTFQLQPGDVLLVGSDGRDDLLLGTAPTGERIINEDEFVFLRVVEEGEGRLASMRDRLIALGGLTDDLSLIRVAYRPEEGVRNEPRERENALNELWERARSYAEEKHYDEAAQVLNEALQLEPRSMRTIRMLVRMYVEQREYDRAISHIQNYVFLRPRDTDMIYLASLVSKKLRRLGDAVEFGERVRLRSPDFVRNQLNLAEVYFALGNKDRAKKMVQEVFSREPDNRKAKRLQEHFDKPRPSTA